MASSADIALRDPERFATLAFLSLRGVGTVTCEDLREKFGSLAEALEAGPARYLQGLNATVQRAHAEQAPREGADRIAQWCERNHVQMIFRSDAGWPARLDDLGGDTPQMIFVRGTLDPSLRTAAVVGTRNATPDGLELARDLGSDFAAHGVVTVSGGASGIDSASHDGALAGRGVTWAVLSAGLGHMYPVENIPLFARIANQGALITEFAPYIENNEGTFIRRNKLIAALGEALVMVEGDLDSGAMHTVEDAEELRRPIFAVPGDRKLKQSKAPYLLLRTGKARLCAHSSDVLLQLRLVEKLEQLGTETEATYSPVARAPVEAPLDASLEPALNALSPRAKHFDDLVIQTGWPAPQLLSALTQLELLGLCEQRPGKLFVRRSG